MPKPVCVKCECFYRPHKNGYSFIEGKPKGTYSPIPTADGKVELVRDRPEDIRGLRAPDAWEPYKLWNGDLWKCPDCGHEIVVGCLNQVSEHYKPDWDEMIIQFDPQITVKDC